MAIVYPVIIVPGITASYLRDMYPLPPEIIWAVLNKDKDYERAALHPDNIRFEVKEPARVVPDQLYEVAYKELLEELRFNLREREDRPVPVFPFSYDWRQPLDFVEIQLSEFIQEVIDRTKLLKHYHDAGYAANSRVNLVGHSMGGLIIAGYLERAGQQHSVAKVATLAAPFQGSFEAVIKITTGTANLGTTPPSSREREAARLTPALYHLIPSFRAGLEAPSDLPQSLFDPSIWQRSITQTIAEFIRLHGLTPAQRKRQAEELFAELLKLAYTHRTRIDKFNLQNAGLTKEDWLCVVGIDSLTRVRLKVVKQRSGPSFEFQATDRENAWSEKDPPKRRFTGDGTVPFEGAIPRFLDLENLVCVAPSDFGYWEIQDLALAKIAGFHGILPNMDMLHRLLVRHFTGRIDRHNSTWGRRAPGADRWRPPMSLRER